MDFDHTIDSNDRGGDDGGFDEEMREAFGRAPANLKDIRGREYRMHPIAWNVGMLK